MAVGKTTFVPENLYIVQSQLTKCFTLVVLQTLGWRCVECAIHHEQDMREE